MQHPALRRVLCCACHRRGETKREGAALALGSLALSTLSGGMPHVDYSKWDAVVADEVCEFGDLDPEERQKYYKVVERAEGYLEEARKEADEEKERQREYAEAPDMSWTGGREFRDYQEFTRAKIELVHRPEGLAAFKKGEYKKAAQIWSLGLEVLQHASPVGPDMDVFALDLYCMLKSNLVQAMIKLEQWDEAKRFATEVLDQRPLHEKALFRRALCSVHFSDWQAAARDLGLVLKGSPGNAEAAELYRDVKNRLHEEQQSSRSMGKEITSDLRPGGSRNLRKDGTLRKLAVLRDPPPDCPSVHFPDRLAAKGGWCRKEWRTFGLAGVAAGFSCRDRPVITAHMTLRSMGGMELFNSRTVEKRPESKEERESIQETQRTIAMLDDLADKRPRMPEEWVKKFPRSPLRWQAGDPMMYKGFDLAAHSMAVGEISVFEVDQPLLEPTVEKVFTKLNTYSVSAGLPSLDFTLDSGTVANLYEDYDEDDVEEELEQNQRQRTVRLELELLCVRMYRDISVDNDGSCVVGVLRTQNPDVSESDPVLRLGCLVRATFVSGRPLDGIPTFFFRATTWVFGEEEGVEGKDGRWVPLIVREALVEGLKLKPLRRGALVEIRKWKGPTLEQLNPLEARRWHENARNLRAPPTSMMVRILEIDSDPDSELSGDEEAV